MHANIYLAEKTILSEDDEVLDKKLVCVKVFKPYADSQSKKCAEQEYAVAQMMRDHQNVVFVNSFE